MSNVLAGKTAVVTGGATGIGRAIALALGRAGANVVVGDLQPDAKPGSYDERSDISIVDLLTEEGRGARFQKTDVTAPDQMRALAQLAVEAFGKLDIWVNNAGVMPIPKLIQDYDDEELDFCLAVNTKGMWNGMRAAIPHLIAAGGGAIVNTISTAGIRPHPQQSVYDISKAAAAQATQCAALELGIHKIRVNGVCPTIVKTAVSRQMVEAPGFENFVKSKLALGELVEVREVADAVVFLASPTASAITGVLLPVDKGEALGPPSEQGLPVQ